VVTRPLKSPQRDRDGRLLPGSTANPSGRPKVWRKFQEAMRERSPEALRRSDEALGSKDPALYQWAAEGAGLCPGLTASAGMAFYKHVSG
jgi:hypothetical protein